jgi:nicotinamidase-related amidase
MTQKIIKHPSGIRQEIVNKVVARRGRLHAFTQLDPVKTALVVVDLDLGTGRDTDQQIKDIAEKVNLLASCLRDHGGVIAWVTTPLTKATDNFRAIFGEELTKRYEADGQSGKSNTLWPELNFKDGDVLAAKSGHSAFFPGKSNLHDQLKAKNIEFLLIVGAVTNVCCESSARDAAELGYKATLISDAMIGHSFGLHEATLATFFRCFGDVRPTEDTLKLVVKGAIPAEITRT